MIRGRATALAVVLVVIAIVVALLGTGPSAARPARHVAARAHQLIARTTAASGGRLWVKRARGGKLSVLHRGDALYVGDTVAVGPGAAATLRLAVPKHVGPSTHLLGFYKQLGAGKPKAGVVDGQIGILLDFAKRFRTVTLRRGGRFIYINLMP